MSLRWSECQPSNRAHTADAVNAVIAEFPGRLGRLRSQLPRKSEDAENLTVMNLKSSITIRSIRRLNVMFPIDSKRYKSTIHSDIPAELHCLIRIPVPASRLRPTRYYNSNVMVKPLVTTVSPAG